MKSWGLNPSMNDVQDIMNELDDSGDGEFDFPEFIEIMAARMQVTMGYIAFEDIILSNFSIPDLKDFWRYINNFTECWHRKRIASYF